MSSENNISKLFKLLRESVSGKEQDYTAMRLNKAIVLLSVPMILEMIMESLFAVIDMYFVNKINVEAVATVGMTESVLALVYSVAIGISMAATAMVSRRIGEKDKPAAARSAAQTVILGTIMSILIGIAGFVYAEPILRLLGASDAVVAEGLSYTQWMFGGNIVILFLFLINGIFRGAGDAFLAMYALIISNVLNIILDPLLIFGLGPIPAMGIEGAAIATNIGRGVGVLFQLYFLVAGPGSLKIGWKQWKPQWDLIKTVLRLSLGGAGQFVIASASWIFLFRIMAAFGDEAIAGYTLGIRIIVFFLLPAWGMANAAATLVGQNLGANQPLMAAKAAWRTAYYNMGFLGLVTILCVFAGEEIINIFAESAAVAAYASDCIFWLSFGYIFYAIGMVLGQAFNGAGDTRTPTILNFFGFWVLQIPLAYLLANTLGYGPRGVFFAIAGSEIVLSLIIAWYFKKGHWQKAEV